MVAGTLLCKKNCSAVVCSVTKMQCSSKGGTAQNLYYDPCINYLQQHIAVFYMAFRCVWFGPKQWIREEVKFWPFILWLSVDEMGKEAPTQCMVLLLMIFGIYLPLGPCRHEIYMQQKIVQKCCVKCNDYTWFVLATILWKKGFTSYGPKTCRKAVLVPFGVGIKGLDNQGLKSSLLKSGHPDFRRLLPGSKLEEKEP